MKIALAQLKSESGKVEVNIQKHLNFITKAAKAKANIVVFPELSLTNYEPRLAKELAFEKNDARFDIFKEYSK
ncbi:Carbon-nitrogen hydrolase [Zunongwangia mangrovi]|uniref:Carbon-nitrogen hydrolase n=1 Tax=Zunongwangia mangrovi TaxID=1334022 RepID=A0A1I1LGJ1_9FLAO|nr:Carbon-nitrogen hydrolase [Zunongwangia mangrovi]